MRLSLILCCGLFAQLWRGNPGNAKLLTHQLPRFSEKLAVARKVGIVISNRTVRTVAKIGSWRPKSTVFRMRRSKDTSYLLHDVHEFHTCNGAMRISATSEFWLLTVFGAVRNDLVSFARWVTTWRVTISFELVYMFPTKIQDRFAWYIGYVVPQFVTEMHQYLGSGQWVVSRTDSNRNFKKEWIKLKYEDG